jgi:hypothetical protein
MSANGARRFLHVARAARRFVAAEPCATSSAGPLESFLMRHDRGKHVRREAEYVRLTSEVFDHVASRVVSGTYRFPYTLAIIEAR